MSALGRSPCIPIDDPIGCYCWGVWIDPNDKQYYSKKQAMCNGEQCSYASQEEADGGNGYWSSAVREAATGSAPMWEAATGSVLVREAPPSSVSAGEAAPMHVSNMLQEDIGQRVFKSFVLNPSAVLLGGKHWSWKCAKISSCYEVGRQAAWVAGHFADVRLLARRCRSRPTPVTRIFLPRCFCTLGRWAWSADKCESLEKSKARAKARLQRKVAYLKAIEAAAGGAAGGVVEMRAWTRAGAMVVGHWTFVGRPEEFYERRSSGFQLRGSVPRISEAG